MKSIIQKNKKYNIFFSLSTDESSAKVVQQRLNPAHNKMIQSPPEKKLPINVSIFEYFPNWASNNFVLFFLCLLIQGTVFYENTMNSDSSSNNKQYNRKSIISSQSTGSSNNEVC